jgi:hypothetical protein
LARGADIFRRASSAFSALFSWEMEMQALTTTMSRMITESIQSSKPLAMSDSTAAASRTRIIGSLIWPRKRLSKLSCRRCSSSFRPYCPRRCCASAEDKPEACPVFSSESTCSVVLLCQLLISTAPFLRFKYQYTCLSRPIQGFYGNGCPKYGPCAAPAAHAGKTKRKNGSVAESVENKSGRDYNNIY